MSDWVLAIDTSTEACSCALGNGAVVYERYTDVPRKHAEKVLPMVDELLAEAGIKRSDLGAIAFGRGPGAFTGLRIAASVVQGLAFALDLPVIPVSSLQALAQRGVREYSQRQTLAAIDARMGEIYWAAYQVNEAGLMEPVCEEYLTAPSNLSEDMLPANAGIANFCGVGTGWQYQGDMREPFASVKNIEANVFTHALDVLSLAFPRFQQQDWVSVEEALPIYLRNNVAHQKTAPKKV